MAPCTFGLGKCFTAPEVLSSKKPPGPTATPHDLTVQHDYHLFQMCEFLLNSLVIYKARH